MTTLWVRVLDLRADEKHSKVNKLRLVAETRTCKKPVRLDVQGDALLTVESHWKFSISSQSAETLSLELRKRCLLRSDKLVGKCILPLAWFPTNHVVREWFPMTLENQTEGLDAKTMILLDVHVDAQGAKKFKAAFSNLRVIPTWMRPADQFSECPAPPQVIFVIQEHGASQASGEQPRYVPVGSAQYPSVETLQSGGYIANVSSNEQGRQYYPPPLPGSPDFASNAGLQWPSVPGQYLSPTTSQVDDWRDAPPIYD
jgi:hypothetical protein